MYFLGPWEGFEKKYKALVVSATLKICNTRGRSQQSGKITDVQTELSRNVCVAHSLVCQSVITAVRYLQIKNSTSLQSCGVAGS